MTASKATQPIGSRRHRVFWTLSEEDHRPAMLSALALGICGIISAVWLASWQQCTVLFLASYLLVKAALLHKHNAGSWAFAFMWPGNHLARFDAVARIAHVSWARQGLISIAAGMAMGLAAMQWGAPWLAVVALVLLWHTGLATLLAAAWWYAGHDVQPICQAPWRAESLTDFWNRRWNQAWRDAAQALIIMPMARFSVGWPNWLRRVLPTSLVLLSSALVHELLISLPAGGGYGGPSAYFALQGCGLLMDHAGLPAARLRAWCFVLLPLPLLVHTPFLQNVILPLL
jgi:hypothetical protein